MTDHLTPAPDTIRPFIAGRIARAGWELPEAVAWAKDREIVDAFRSCVMLVRLCGDHVSRTLEPWAAVHRWLHRRLGYRECVGNELLEQTKRSLGISDTRAKFLIDQLDAETNAAAGLTGDQP